MNLADAFTEAERLNRLIDLAIDALKNTTVEYAKREAEYRKAKAQAWVQCPRDEEGARDWTAARREAWVNAETSDLRYHRDIADGMRQAALEAVRSRRSQLSSLQTLLNAEKEEMALARTGPN